MKIKDDIKELKLFDRIYRALDRAIIAVENLKDCDKMAREMLADTVNQLNEIRNLFDVPYGDLLDYSEARFRRRKLKEETK